MLPVENEKNVSPRPHLPASGSAPSGPRAVSVAPHTSEQAAPSPRRHGWLHYSNLKIEAAIFLLIALTFAAVLGESAITSQKLLITPTSGQYYTYSYSDPDSKISETAAQSLKWSCTIKAVQPYPYCGYGLRLGSGASEKGANFTHYRDIVLRLTYHGSGHSLKLSLRNTTPPALKGKVSDKDLTYESEFPVVNGENVIHLTTEQLAMPQWWVDSHNLTLDEAHGKLDHVTGIDILSGTGEPAGRFDVGLQSLSFSGAFLSTEQWYLIILGVWLVLTGAFLVYRFLGLRRGFEAQQRRQAEESRVLAAAHAAAEAASAAKSQFLANMSHELRTPLNAVIGYAQLLQGDALNDKQASAIKTIQQSGEHLLTVISDILDIAKVEAGKMELLPATFDLHTCITSVEQMIRLRAEEKGLDFHVVIADDVPRTVVADQKRVRQVLINLLGNAVKFTASGEIRLEVSTVSATPSETLLRFDVCDTGVGIPEDHIGRIFRPFEQAGNAIDRSGGTGLGLSITSQIVQMMGGGISVESMAGKGSRFRIEAPFQTEATALAAPQARLTAAERFEILVVDDNDSNVALLRTALEDRGFNISTAGNGLEAISLTQTVHPDLILMDVRMPVVDGIEAIRHLKSQASTRDIPIIVVTANPTPDTEATALAAGADRMLAKPVDLDVLTACVSDLLARADASSREETAPMVAPTGEIMARLLGLARAGNLRAIRKEIPAIQAMGPQYHRFAERLDTLAAAYQSPAVLRLVEQFAPERTVA